MGPRQEQALDGRTTGNGTGWEANKLAESEQTSEEAVRQTKAGRLWRWVALWALWLLELWRQNKVFQVQHRTPSGTGRRETSSGSG
eukprot:6287869-Amphidinium_carterae.7